MVFLTNLNLSKNELQNAVVQPLSTAPASAVQGQIYYNTVDLTMYQYTGSEWKQIGATYILPAATGSTLGGVIVGDGLSVDGTGIISVDIGFSDLTSHPTTVSGYGITDASVSGQSVSIGGNSVSVPEASSTSPKMNGTAKVGTETAFAKGDHVHPTDTSRAPKSHAASASTYGVGTTSNYGHVKLSDATNGNQSVENGVAATPKAVSDALSAATGAIPSASATTPLVDGIATPGSDTSYARGDHIHPTDTSRAPLASPAFTGTPTAPTAANGTNSTQIATTAFVQNTLSYADAMIFKGTIGESGTVSALPNTHEVGWTYKVITAATYAGQKCEIGDLIICITDGTVASDSDWTVVQTNIDGVITGPSSATPGHIATFNGTTGRIIQDGYGVASSISNDSTTIPTTAAVNSAVTGLIKKATGTISTSQTSRAVSYTGTLVGAYATMGGSVVQLDMAVTSSAVTFSTANNPSATVTCTVVYA